MSITDDIMGKAPDQLAKTMDLTLKAAHEAKSGVKDVAGAVKGICLLLIKSDFSESAVMQAVKAVAFKKTGDIKFAKQNIDIEKLRKSGHVYKVEDNVVADVMKAFDKQCKKHGVKYSAMVDTRGEDKPDYKPSYMVFFEGKDDTLIINALTEAYKDYAEQQKKEAEKDAPQKKKGLFKGKKEQTTTDPEQRESVKAKLAFFRDRVTARDKERDAVEKHHQHDDISR